MIHLKPRIKSLLLLGLSLFLIASAAPSLAQGNGKNNNIGFVNGSDGIMGRIVTGKRIVYTGQELEISVRFARGAQLVRDQLVDAYVVIFSPDPIALAAVVPIDDMDNAAKQRLFRVEAVDLSELPAGQYQLGLVLTIPDGDPLVVLDWHKGFLGLLDVVGLTISAEALDIDQDGDGEVDNDADGDGFVDDDENGTDDDSSNVNDLPNEDETPSDDTPSDSNPPADS